MNELPADGQGWRAARNGVAEREGARLVLSDLYFYRTDPGFLALIQHLQQHRCRAFKYDISEGDDAGAILRQTEE